jgi:MFS transporter, ACS family, tartrate transporter
MSFTSALPRSPSTDDEAFGKRVLAKAMWRLVPLLSLLYVVNILDRGNPGFARLTMEPDLRMGELTLNLGFGPFLVKEFDFALGLFYFGYLLFEVPSNLLLRRFGARRWISRILITWGIVSCATMAVKGTTSFAIIRILLGVAEAGFFPGIVLYLTYWFPAKDRARVMALFMTGNAFAAVVGYPLSGWIMRDLPGVAGLAGWQWLFLLEGLPSVLLGIVVLYTLPDRPADARWLSPPERDWLEDRLHREDSERRQRHGADRLMAMLDWRVWLLIAIYFTVAIGSNASSAYLPTIVKDKFEKLTLLENGFVSALPHLCAMVGMTLMSISSDRMGERSWHLGFAALLAAGGWYLAYAAPNPKMALLGLCIAQAGMMSMLPIFWTLPTVFLTGAAAAGGIALINSVANIGGLIGPSILGASILAGYGIWPMAAILFVGAGLAVCVRPEKHMRKSKEGEPNRV